MKGKRIGTSVLAALMLAGTTATSALAAMPDQTAVIGEKAFSLKYVNASENESEIRSAIQEAMKSGKGIYVKARNVWYNNDESKLTDTSVIPAVVYKSAEGEVSYEAGDGEEATEGFAIKEISATGTHEITVSFTEAVEEAARDKASFVAKKGKTTREISKVEWNEDKTAAVITLYSKITKGDYTVEAKGLELETATGEFKAEDEKIVDIKFKEEQTPVVGEVKDGNGNITNPGKVTVNFELINQYGDASKIGTPIVQATIAKDSSDKDSATFAVPANAFANPLTQEYVYVVSIVVEGTTVTKQATLKIVKEAKLDSIELGDVYTKFDKKADMKAKNPTASDDTTFYMATVLKDQYGNVFNRDNFDAAKLTADAVLAENHAAVEGKAGLGGMQVQAGTLEYRYVVNTEDSKDKTIYLQLKGKTNAMLPANIIAMVTGKVVTKEVEILAATKTDSLSYSLPEYVVFGEKNELQDVEVYNTNGDLVKGDDLVDAFKGGLLTPSTGYGAIEASYNPETEKVTVVWDLSTGVAASVKQDADAYAFLTTKTGTNKLSNQNVTIKAAAYPMDASIKADVAMLMLPNTSSTIKLSDINVYDQYSRTMETKKIVDLVGTKISLCDADGNIITGAKTTTGTPNYKWSIAAKAEAGSQTLKVKIVAGKNTATNEFALRTIKASEVVSIHADAPEMIFSGVYTEGGANPGAGKDYAKDFVVYGKTKSGAKVNLESSKANEYYTLIKPDSLTISGGSVYSNKATDLGKDKKKDVLVHVIANVGSDINPVTKTIELKSDAPKLSTVTMKDDKSVIIVDGDFTVEDYKKVVEVKDQYGVKFAANPTTVIFLDKKGGTTKNADFSNDADKLVDGLPNGKTVKIRAFYNGNTYITFTVKAYIK